VDTSLLLLRKLSLLYNDDEFLQSIISDIHGSNAAFFSLLYTIRAKMKPETKTVQPNTKGYGYPVVHVYKQEGISINPSKRQR